MKHDGRAPVRSKRLLGGPPRRKLCDMTKAAEKILAEALTLETQERANVAAKLIASLDGEPEEDVEAAWAAEVARRIDEIEAGQVESVPWEDVERRIEREILKR